MKHNFYFILFFFIGFLGFSQTLPIFRYHKPLSALNLITTSSTFGYSLRKLSTSYTGFAVRLRRNSAGAPEANVAFDIADIVSGNSIVTITKAGDGLIIGQQMTLTTFISTNQVFVIVWYNQGSSAFDATQVNSVNQPELKLNSAGAGGNTKPSILFVSGFPTLAGGGDYLIINQPIENIVAQGIRGTFMFAIKVAANLNHFAFGYRNNSTNWRWSFHVNWSDGKLYFDSAEVCCATNRATPNGANLNLWKQYTIVRGNTYKTVRISGATTGLNNSTAASTTQSGGQFHIGSAQNNTVDQTFSGNISELLMFPTDLPLSDIVAVENNQIAFWSL